MMRRMPIIGSAAGGSDILFALRKMGDRDTLFEFKNMLSVIAGARNVYPVNSGIAAFYIILKALSRLSPNKEIVLPAYTAGSLVIAVRKAGLKPVLCDVSLVDFNMDTEAVLKSISSQTLAVVAVHMFGIGLRGTAELRSAMPKEVYLLEDCCQAMGSIVSGHPVGSCGDISFFSFNRGKNLPLGGGGFVSTEDASIAKAIEDEIAGLEDLSAIGELLSLSKVLAVSIATNPFIYALGHGITALFKETAVPGDFAIKKMNHFQIALGMRLLKRMEELSSKRYNNGTYIINGLKGCGGMLLPMIPADSKPAFNRLPIVFKDVESRTLVEHALAGKGIETSRMYLRALHNMFDLGYERAFFPNANYVAQNLLTLPVYPGVGKKDLDRMISAVKGALK